VSARSLPPFVVSRIWAARREESGVSLTRRPGSPLWGVFERLPPSPRRDSRTSSLNVADEKGRGEPRLVAAYPKKSLALEAAKQLNDEELAARNLPW
jgi:hypothetical protein